MPRPTILHFISNLGVRRISPSFVRTCSTKPERTQRNPKFEVGNTEFQSLKGRDLITFEKYTRSDIYSMLWIATELKLMKAQCPALELCQNKRVGLIWSSPVVQASLANATNFLNTSLSCFHEDQVEKASKNYEMMGRALGSAADITFLDTPSWSQAQVEEFATGSLTPIVTVTCKDSSPALAYSELLTLFEKFGFLRRLEIAYIGSNNDPMLNTYFSLLPTVGAHLRLMLNGSIENLASWGKGLKLSKKYNTEIKQVERLEDAIYRAHTLSTSFQENPSFVLNIKHVEEMDLDWVYLQSDVFKGLNAPKDFLKEKNHTLIGDSIENQAWAFKAIITAHTTDYSPVLQPPRFEGVT